LFDIAHYTRDLEQAFSQIWKGWSEGLPAASFAVATVPQMSLPQAIERIGFGQCPLCGSCATKGYVGADCGKHPFYRSSLPAQVNWLRCETCNHIFTEGYFDAKVSGHYFGKTPPHEYVGFDMENLRSNSAKCVERIARHAVMGEWLDVNFGNASLLFCADEWGFVPVGLEARQQNVMVLKGLGVEAHVGTIESFEGSRRFSVISLRDVLNRMPYPQSGLQAAHRLLREDGVLYLSMPNIGSMAWHFLHANQANPYWSEIQNVHLFSRERLFAFLTEHGFKPVYFNIDDQGRVRMEVIAVPIQLAGSGIQ
jgi:SAM-dependent methyltransferase